MSAVTQIAKYTYIEIIRSKVLYAIIAFTAVLIAISSAFANVTIGDPIKMIKDIGLCSISIFGVLFVTISGSTLLSKELQRKTIYNILSRPIGRDTYLIGKFFGLWGASVTLNLGMIAALTSYLMLLGDTGQIGLLVAGAYMALDLLITCAVLSLICSVFVTPFLSGLITFCICFAGRFVSHLEYFIADGAGTWAKTLAWVLPRFDLTNISNSISYGTIPTSQHFGLAALYALCYTTALLAIAGSAFKTREFN